MARLIVTNGDAAIARLRAAGIEDEILAWDDVLHDGPVPAGLSLEELSAVRARFLAVDLGLPGDRPAAMFQRRDEQIRAHGRFETVELWFEHDLYDQLQLIQVLDFLAAEGRRDGVLLMQADDYLGTQPADAIRALAPTARAVTAEQFEAARSAWVAFTASTPAGIPELAATGSNGLPYLPQAFLRLLAELPSPAGGLSLTEERVLAALGEGRKSAAALFKTVAEQESALFMGDASFFRRLDGLNFATHKLINGLPYSSRECGDGDGPGPRYRAYAKSEVAITDAGRAALAGRFDHAAENGIDRWLGGTHVTRETLWRWDRKAERLIAP